MACRLVLPQDEVVRGSCLPSLPLYSCQRMDRTQVLFHVAQRKALPGCFLFEVIGKRRVGELS